EFAWMRWFPGARGMGPKSNPGLLAVKVWLTVVVPTVRLTVRLPVRRVRPFRSRWALRVSPALALTVEVAVAVWFPDPAEPLYARVLWSVEESDRLEALPGMNAHGAMV